jgi:anti-anti-sigma factor
MSRTERKRCFVGTIPAAVSPRRFLLTSENKNGFLILTCAGRLNAEVAQEFKTKVKALLSPTARIVLDMGGVTHVDSSGLGAVVSVYASAKTIGCQFQICSLTESVKKIFGLTKVLGAFESCGAYLTKMP